VCLNIEESENSTWKRMEGGVGWAVLCGRLDTEVLVANGSDLDGLVVVQAEVRDPRNTLGQACEQEDNTQ